MSPKSQITNRVFTIAFGALPVLLLLPFVVLWMLSTMAIAWGSLLGGEGVDVAIALFFVAWGVFALWGAYSLWAAALGPIPVTRANACGLVAGITAMIFALALLGRDGTAGFPNPGALWIGVGPIFVAAWHIFLFLKE